jgi:hypothetical protein
VSKRLKEKSGEGEIRNTKKTRKIKKIGGMMRGRVAAPGSRALHMRHTIQFPPRKKKRYKHANSAKNHPK